MSGFRSWGEAVRAKAEELKKAWAEEIRTHTFGEGKTMSEGITGEVGLDGAFVFWDLTAWSSRAKLAEAFRECGLGKFVPKERTPRARLKSALKATFPGLLVRGVKGEKGYEVVRESCGSERNSYAHVVTVLVAPDGDSLGLPDGESYPESDPAFDALEAAYRGERDRVFGSSLSLSLVAAVDSIGGTRLKQAGGVYWVHESKAPQLLKLAGLLRKPESGGHSLSVVRHARDEEAVRAVLKSFREETAAKVAELRERVRGTGNDTRRVASQQRAAEGLRARIKQYEGFLSTELSDLVSELDGVEEDLIETKLAAAVA